MGTPAVARDAAVSHVSPIEPASVDGGRFVSLLCGLAAAWIAAGSTGLLGHALRHALTLVFLAAALATGLPPLKSWWSRTRALALSLAVVAVIVMAASPHPPINVLAAALLLAALATVSPVNGRTAFVIASFSILMLGLYRFALTSIPWFWLLMDQVAPAVTLLPGLISRQPLKTGATFAGLDFLVLMFSLAAMWATRLPRPRTKRVLCAVAFILAAHGAYLIALSFGPRLLSLLPAAKTEAPFGVTPPWDFAQAMRTLIPWNMPALGALLHLVVAAWLCKTLPSASGEFGRAWPRLQRLPRFAVPVLIVVLALAIPALTSLQTTRLSLVGKKIVFYEKGFLNWLKPKHGEYGRLSVGMYGMMADFLQHYGASCVVSPELSAADLQGAQLLVLIFPNKPWAEGQLERIWNFVREGGSLIVLGEHTVQEKEGGSRFNDVLQPTALRVAFDSAMFEVGGWLESYEALGHPATAGLEDFRNDFGVVIGASVEAHWPARPMLSGRFGFSDPGDRTNNDEAKGGSMMGNHKYDAGEKLGDQLVAAEQRWGRGRVVAFGDTSGFSNSILFGSHDFVARLFASLCQESGISSGRLAGAALALVLLLFLLRDAMRPVPLGMTALALSASLSFSLSVSHRHASVIPDGRHSNPNRLAYLDVAHLERASGESWREEGPGGLQLTLMRSGYTVLGLDEFDPARLQGAGLFVSLGPGRPFSSSEILAVREFIASGGIFICTVGWPESRASRRLLSELGFYVGGIGAATSGHPEPRTFGHFKAPYFNGGDYMAYVRFHAAWNVESNDPEARPIAYGPRDPKSPADQPDPTVILMRRLGRGKAVVIADTEFAMNKNLEREGGQPFEGMRENADFWRWLLDYLNDQPAWTPPRPIPSPAGTTNNTPPAP